MVYSTRCPAKVNAYLKVLDKDASGFHPIESEFWAISLFDEIFVETGAEGFECIGMELPPSNTVLKAYRLAREAYALPKLKIKLFKHIPAEAGLGGGSSDAAGLLRIVRELIPKGAAQDDLASIASAVGSDVSFFMQGGRCHVSGYGELVSPLPDEIHHLVLAFPDCQCSTAEMYQKLDEARKGNAGSQSQPKADSLSEFGFENSFHQVMPKPCIEAIKKLHQVGAETVGLSGSGSTVFGRAKTEDHAKELSEQLNAHRLSAIAVQTITHNQSQEVIKWESIELAGMGKPSIIPSPSEPNTFLG